MYNCKTCNYSVCNACTKTCHENHEVTSTYYYSNSSVCNCGAQKDGSCNNMVLPLNKELCTLTVPKRQQHVFYCITCSTKFKSQLEEAGEYGAYACARCIKICHKNHSKLYTGIGNQNCSCGLEKYSPCMALAKKKENGADSSA